MKKKPLNVRRESTSLSGLLQEMRGGRKIDKMAGYLIRKMKGLSGAKFKGAQTIKYSTRGKIGGGRGGPLKFPIALVVDGEVLRTFATKEKRSEFISWAKQNGFGVATEDDLRVARRSGAGQAQKRTSPPPGKTSMAAVRQAIENAESLAAHAKSIAKALRDQPVSEANVRRADLIMLAVDMMVQFLEEAVTKNREPSSFAIDTMKRMGSSIAAKLQ